MAFNNSIYRSPWARFLEWSQRVELVGRLTFFLVLASVASGILTYVAISTSSPFGPDPQTVLILLLIDLLLLLSLGIVVSRRLVILWLERRRGSAGSHLHTRMVLLFGLVAVAPAIIVSVFSALFFNIGLDSWFNERVSTAIDESVAVAESYLQEHQQKIRAEVLEMANELDRNALEIRNDKARFRSLLRSQASIRNLSEAIVFNRKGDILARSGLSFSMEFDLVDPSDLVLASQGNVVVITAENAERVRALVRLDRFVDTYLYVGSYVDSSVLIHADKTKSAAAEYQRLERDRGDLQITFALIFIVVALLLLLTAVLVALLFASRLVGPVSNLVNAAEEVSEGNLSARVPEGPEGDEIGGLSRAFNRMTSQLEGQRTELMAANEKLDTRRRFTEAVLSGVSSAVIGISFDGTVNLPNRAALSQLETTLENLIGKNLFDFLPELKNIFKNIQSFPDKLVSGQIEIERNNRIRTLHYRISAELSETNTDSFVVTFDDVTDLLTAQRNAAWSDIARRIAHEIKNPLTPIQLSAERLQKKYLSEVGSDKDVFKECTDTIIRQVNDIGSLIDEFSSFARMPAPVFKSVDFVKLVKQSIFLQEVSNQDIEYITQLPSSPLIYNCDSRQISQVFTNLLLNSSQAIDGRLIKNINSSKGKIFINLTQSKHRMQVEIIDNGVGLPKDIQNRLVEPYVTTKEKGTGLGLAIVAKVVDDHDGDLHISNNTLGGATVKLNFPLDGREKRSNHSPKDKDSM